MSLTGQRTFVGLGFGPIQAGLFLYEAFVSGAFGRLVVGEVLPDVVAAVRAKQGWYSLNIAHLDRVEISTVGPIDIRDPAVPSDAQRLAEAVAEAEEISTAVPSVRNYVSPGPGSIHRILAEGLRRKVERGGPRAVVYAAENHNEAAEVLEAAVRDEIPAAERSAVRAQVRFLNTVIGKMSGVVSDAAEIHSRSLAPITPEAKRAFLVEEFNRILVSKTCSEAARFTRGLAVFKEKEDLLPFEEAKLYGHNATHALAAYLGSLRGVERIADLRRFPALIAFIRAAFLEESGEALIRKHAGKDTLFTPGGFREFADDLLERMTNPYLQDTVERVGRDPDRKLGWDDRLIGTMRVALQQKVAPRRYAVGAAAALARLDPSFLESTRSAGELVDSLWQEVARSAGEERELLALIEDARKRLRRWRQSGFEDFET
jgi:mannitol-1-phosphate 5-dehydrogenase